MADTAKRLSGPTLLTTSAVTKYTVPASTTTILRSIHVANETGVDHALTLSIGAAAAGAYLFKAQPVLANDSFDWTGFIPMAAAETLQALADANSALTLTISGVEVA